MPHSVLGVIRKHVLVCGSKNSENELLINTKERIRSFVSVSVFLCLSVNPVRSLLPADKSAFVIDKLIRLLTVKQ